MADDIKLKRLPADRLVLGHLGYDDIATVRYIHAASYRLIAGQYLDAANVEAFSARILAPEYTDRLADAVRNRRLVGVRLDSELVAAANWTARPAAARLDGLFVRPLLTGIGIGTALLERVEQEVRQAGFDELSASVPLDGAAFFEARGYTITAHGALSQTAPQQIPVAFMRKTLTATAASPRDADAPTSAA